MSTKTKRISELPEGTTLSGFYTIGAQLVSGAWNSIRVNLGFVQTAADNATAGAAAANTAADKANTATSDLRALETTVKQSETDRVSAETARKTAEIQRATAETARKTAEDTRASNETARKTAETTRQAQETARETNSATAVKNANAATDRLTTLCDNRDKVVDGYWWHYNESTKAYENTGEIAKGNVMYATFEVTDAGQLLMYTDEEYTGANFKLDAQGRLSVII